MSKANVLGWDAESEKVAFRVPAPLLDEFDEAVEQGHYPSRSEAFRDAVRAMVRERGER